MRFLMKCRFPIEAGNQALKDPQFGANMQQILSDMKAEAAYFTTIGGQRGCYIVVNMEETSQMPAIAEPLFFYLKADVEWMPVMIPQDLQKGGPGIGTAIKNWG